MSKHLLQHDKGKPLTFTQAYNLYWRTIARLEKIGQVNQPYCSLNSTGTFAEFRWPGQNMVATRLIWFQPSRTPHKFEPNHFVTFIKPNK